MDHEFGGGKSQISLSQILCSFKILPKGEGGGKGGVMTQSLYVHMNKGN
jgi:hypothetical protein